jgi:tetratricopeptide (TPR) repeat protein
MSRHAMLSGLRLELDHAITYSTKKEAMAVCRRGLSEARERKLPGEIEYFRAQALIIRNQFASAIDRLDAAIQVNASDGAAYNDRALCMVELGIIDEALPYFDKGIAVEPDFATIHHNKGWLLNNIGRHTEAVACFRRALALEPCRPVTYDNLADALYNLGDYRGAVQAYEKVLALLGPQECRQIKKLIREKIELIHKYIANTA